MDEGEISPKEYDYLLSMPMWSVTEEKADELRRQMDQKRQDFEALEKKHIYTLWKEDLNGFLEELSKVEEKEERDRLAHGSVKNEGKKNKARAR